MTKPTCDQTASAKLARRGVLIGAGTATVLAGVASVLPQSPAPEALQAAAAAVKPASSGYQLTEHVQRYYETARV